MTQQLINVQTGEFTLGHGFVVSSQTTVNDLLSHFGEEQVAVNDFKNGHCNYAIRNLQVGELYFILTFYFFNEALTKISFLVNAERYDDNASWDNFNEQEEIKKGKFMEQWMAKQMQGDYKRYDWGKMEVSYDFHNLSSSCAITYNAGQ